MISILTGKIGAGKTLHGVEFIYDALCEGRTVATNIELVFPKLALLALQEKGIVLQEEQIMHLDLNEAKDWQTNIPWGVTGKPTLVVLDEIHLFFNSRDYAKTDKHHRSILSFLSQSRKACVDVIFIAQVPSQVEKQFRAQCKTEIAIMDFCDMYLPILGKIPLRQNIMTTRNLDSGEVMRKQRRDYPSKMFGCYNTLAFLDDEMQAMAETKQHNQPLELSRVKGAQKKQQIEQLIGQYEILDNNSSSSYSGGFRGLLQFLGLTRHEKSRGEQSEEESETLPGSSAPGTL
jgi:zona occludens toxin (predicted ATPase)